MLALKTIVDQVELTRSGHIQVRFGKLRIKDGKIIACQWHRTAFGPDQAWDSALVAVNAHLPQLGEVPVIEAQVPESELTPQTVRDQVGLLHTPERVAIFREQQALNQARFQGLAPPLPPFDLAIPLDEKTIVSEVKLCRNGCIRVHFDNLVMRGKREVSAERYRPYLELKPGDVVDTSMGKINAQLQFDGYPPLDTMAGLSALTPQGIAQIVAKLHTPECIARYKPGL